MIEYIIQLQPLCTVTGEVEMAKRDAVNHLVGKPTSLLWDILSSWDIFSTCGPAVNTSDSAPAAEQASEVELKM